ncbi:MAG: NINE protein [Chitinophagales bacterium]|nr:NINE protein [Bacteroidota bacterium]
MKSKKTSIILALLGGSAGADRFYLGQNTAGWVTLLTFWLLIPGAVFGIIKFNLVPNWEPFMLGRFALPIVFHLYETGRYMVMSDQRFMSQDESKSKTFPLTIASFVISALLIVGGSRMLKSAMVVDIVEADVSAVLSAEAMSQEFRTDEEVYRKKYDNLVLQIEGEVSETGNDFEAGSYFALKGLNNDPFGIKCYFLEQNVADANMVKLGDKIIMKGVANGNKLENCKVISINGKKVSQ